MRVFVGCEFSGIVRDAFLAAGHDAISCDLLPSESPGPHFQGDIYDALASCGPFDLAIIHPPCTAVAVSGNHFYTGSLARLTAIYWTTQLWRTVISQVPFACLENPVGVLPFAPSQYIQPWEFGHPESKKTGLWLHNLPLLEPTHSRPEHIEERVLNMSPGPDRQKERSRFFEGVAAAMAEQWPGSGHPQMRLLG